MYASAKNTRGLCVYLQCVRIITLKTTPAKTGYLFQKLGKVTLKSIVGKAMIILKMRSR